MLSHDLERMMSAGMKIELLPSIKGVYKVRIISGKKVYRGGSPFGLVQAIENAQQKMYPTLGESAASNSGHNRTVQPKRS